MAKRWLTAVGSYCLAGMFLLTVWEMASILLQTPMLPSPVMVFKSIPRLWGNTLQLHVWISAYRVLASLAISMLIAVPFGLIMGFEKTVDRFLAPIVYLTYPIPKIVFLPLVLLFLGLGDHSKIFLITFIVSYQILVTTRDAVRKVVPEAIHSLRSLGASRLQIYRYLLLPSCLPDVLTALRLSLGTAVSVLFFVETFATTEGLGYFIMNAWSRAASDEMFAGIIMMGLLGIVLFLLVDLLERIFVRWRRLIQREN